MEGLNKKLLKIHSERRQPLEVEAYDFLISEGFKFPRYYYVTNEEEMNVVIKKLQENTNQKYAFKAMSPKILHKSDFQAVHLGVSIDEAMDKYHELQYKFKGLDLRGILIVPMASEGVELLLGSTYDSTFGLITVFGVGGTLVEILKDVTFGKSPLSREDADLMIESINSQDLLKGPRGLPKLNKISMIDLMVKLSETACKYKSLIKEIDINPLRVTAQGIFPLDARIIFHFEIC